jgi:hypothetical protein
MGIIREQDRDARVIHLDEEEAQVVSRSQAALTAIELRLPTIISEVSENARNWLISTGKATCGIARLPKGRLWPAKGDPVAQDLIKVAMLEVEPNTSSVEIRDSDDRDKIEVVVTFSPVLI